MGGGDINQAQWEESQFFPISNNMMKVVILALAAAVVLGAPQNYPDPPIGCDMCSIEEMLLYKREGRYLDEERKSIYEKRSAQETMPNEFEEMLRYGSQRTS